MKKMTFQAVGFSEVPPYAQRIVHFIGLGAINWAKIEQTLHIMLLQINRPKYSESTFRPVPNVSFRKKIQIFKKWYVDDERFSHLGDKPKRMYSSLKKANKDRQLLFHSSIQEFLPGPPPAIRIQNVQHDNNQRQVTVSTAEWTEQNVENFAAGAFRLSHGLRELAQETLTDEFLSSLEIG